MHNDKRRLIKHALMLGAFSLLPFSLTSQVLAAETVKVCWGFHAHFDTHSTLTWTLIPRPLGH